MNPFNRDNEQTSLSQCIDTYFGEEPKGPAINEPPKATQEYELSVITKGDGYSGEVVIHEAGKDTADELNGRLIIADRSLCESLKEVR